LGSVQLREFSGPQQPVEHIDLDATPNVATETWMKISSSLKEQMADGEYDERLKPRIEFTIKYCDMMARTYPNKEVNRGPTQVEAGAMDQIASVLDNVGYKQGEELLYRVNQGYDSKQEYFTECTLYGQFGTEDRPVYVPSTQNHRLVGCLGGHDGIEEHDLIWFVLRQGPKHRCPLCGQIFQLVTTDPSHPDHPLHDPEVDYKNLRFQRMSVSHPAVF